MNIYDLEQVLRDKINDSADDVLNYAILETMPPIADYSNAIKVLKENYSKYHDFRIAVLACFLSSTWENYKSNDFIDIINSFIETSNNQQKSIIYYLNAYDMAYHGEYHPKNAEYTRLLKKSIELSVRFVYNYVRLAKVSDQIQARELIEEALSRVERVYDSKDLTSDLISYERYLNEHILGIELSEPNYKALKDFESELEKR